MRLRRASRKGLVLVLAGIALLPACERRKAEINDIAPSFQVNRARAPLGSAIETTLTWTLGQSAKRVPEGYNAFIQFLDSHKVVLFAQTHVPTPPPSSWEPGKAYSYKKTFFIPVYPYVGDVQVVMGLVPASGRGERLGLTGEDIGLRAYKVGKMEFLPQTDNIFLVYKEGWHSPESSPSNPSLDRTWTKKEALVSFKNPNKDIVVYLEADTNHKAFQQPPVLTMSVGAKTGALVPVENSEVFLRKIRVKGEDLGAEEWVDLRLSMNQSFIPKALGINQDERELGMLVYHLFVGEAEKLGQIPSEGIVDAGPLPASAIPASAKAPAKAAAAKPAPKKS